MLNNCEKSEFFGRVTNKEEEEVGEERVTFSWQNSTLTTCLVSMNSLSVLGKNLAGVKCWIIVKKDIFGGYTWGWRMWRVVWPFLTELYIVEKRYEFWGLHMGVTHEEGMSGRMWGLGLCEPFLTGLSRNLEVNWILWSLSCRGESQASTYWKHWILDDGKNLRWVGYAVKSWQWSNVDNNCEK